MATEKPAYFIDKDDELMYLEMMEDLDTTTAIEMYNKIKGDKVRGNLSKTAASKTFDEYTYKNLRYIILGCKQCSAEDRLKALATFIFKTSLPIPMNPLVSNDHLKKILFDNLNNKISEIYKWYGLEYEES